ncbi:hypothetical protein D3C75_825120 [compost metagenome]
MCATANAKVIAKAPVVQVVLALITRFRVGRGFILLVARSSQKFVALLEDIPKRVVVRQFWRAGAEQSIRLNRQLIPREMRRVQFNRLA